MTRYLYQLMVVVVVIKASQALSNENSLVATKNGKIQGVKNKLGNGKLVQTFLGIPFAKPPVNELRFKPPTPMEPWNAPWNATFKRSSCIQGSENQVQAFPKYADITLPENAPVSEDCLYLNMWVPTASLNNYAVMVFVHGGGFLSGSSALDALDGGILASEENVVVINLNYRLSVLGLLYLNDDIAPGNVGLMDQTMALTWVRENVEAFGGDSERITFFGHSSGAASVNFHLFLPSSQGLFSRVIIESGSALTDRFFADIESSLSLSSQLAKSENCQFNTTKDIAECLRSKRATDLISASIQSNIQYLPTIDGNYIPAVPEEMLANGFLNRSVDIMEGHCTADGFKSGTVRSGLVRDEVDFYASEKYFENYINETLSIIPYKTGKIQRVKDSYSQDPNAISEYPNFRRQLLACESDVLVICNMNMLAVLATRNGNRVYQYQYSYVPASSKFFDWEQVPHAAELFFVFGKPFDPAYANYTDEDRMFSKRVMSYWANFAKYGSPNGPLPLEGLFRQPQWPRYSTELREEFVLNNISYVETARSPEICLYL